MNPTALIDDARHDMRQAYLGGAPGLLASSLAWLVAGLVALAYSPTTAVLALFAGGVLIYPVSLLICKLLGRSGAHARGNPLAALAMEGTLWMLLCLPLAYVVSLYRIEWFFPAMLLVIGGRYLTFATLYGLRLYWACGAILFLAAYGLAAMKAAPHVGAFTGAAIEAAFAVIVFITQRR